VRLFISLIMSLLFVSAIAAQESPYELALARIEAAEASGVSELDLSDMGLSEVPPEIGNLVNLQTLTITNNQRSSLPPEIGNLSSLR
jgi:internalin A